jgi:acetoin:2,6-dichlorophenolindophenol oxidoreductase subunit alpha
VISMTSTSPTSQRTSEPRWEGFVADADPRLVGAPGEPLHDVLYRRMAFVRTFEQTLLDLFDEGVLNGTTHCCIGQEADAVGVIDHLRRSDHVFSNHRCHGHYLAKTGDAVGLLAEIMGTEKGICRGRGGSQHVCAEGFKSNGVLGGTVPAAAGIALAQQLSGSDDISVVFIGDGTLGEGIVYETLNVASLWRLPFLIVCEDNGWAQSTPRAHNLAGNIADRFTAFDIPVCELDTTDVGEIHRAAGQEIAAARSNGPRCLLLHTYRLCHHSKNDDSRPANEVSERWALDPLVVHRPQLDSNIQERIEREVAEAIGRVVDEVRRTQ